MRPSEAPPGAPAAWLIGRALEWQVAATEVALAAPILAWRTGLALAGGWAAAEAMARQLPEPPAAPSPGPVRPEAVDPEGPATAAAVPEPAEEVDHLA